MVHPWMCELPFDHKTDRLEPEELHQPATVQLQIPQYNNKLGLSKLILQCAAKTLLPHSVMGFELLVGG